MQVYRDRVIDALNELADRDYQERVWSGLDPRLMSSLTECIEELFDDSGLVKALHGVRYLAHPSTGGYYCWRNGLARSTWGKKSLSCCKMSC